MSSATSLPFGVNDTAVRTTLASGITSTDTSVDVSEVTNPPALPFLIAVFVDQSPLREDDMEIMEVTGISGTTLTVNRGQKGTAAQSFSSGDKVFVGIVPSDVFDKVNQSDQVQRLNDITSELLLKERQNEVALRNELLDTGAAIQDVFVDESKVFSKTDVTITDVNNDEDPDGRVEISNGGNDTPGTVVSEAKNLYDAAGFIYLPDEAYPTIDADIPADEDVAVTLADGYGNSVQCPVGEFTDVSALNSSIVRVDPLELTSSDGNDTPTVRSYAIHIREGVGDWDNVLADFFPDEDKITNKTDVVVTTEGDGVDSKIELGSAGTSQISINLTQNTEPVGREGVRIETNNKIKSITPTVALVSGASDNPNNIYISDINGNTILSDSFSNGDSFNVTLEANKKYDIEFDSDAYDYQTKFDDSNYPYTSSNFDIISEAGGDTGVVVAVDSIEASAKASQGTFDTPQQILNYTPSEVKVNIVGASLELDLTDENNNTDKITTFGSKVSLSNITGTQITPTWRLKRSDGADTPTLEEYEIRFFK